MRRQPRQLYSAPDRSQTLQLQKKFRSKKDLHKYMDRVLVSIITSCNAPSL